jgi:hypothetical protein
MIDPKYIGHPLDIRYEFKEEFKKQIELETTSTVYPHFSLISGMSYSHSLDLRIRHKDSCEVLAQQIIPISFNLLKEKSPYEY